MSQLASLTNKTIRHHPATYYQIHIQLWGKCLRTLNGNKKNKLSPIEIVKKRRVKVLIVLKANQKNTTVLILIQTITIDGVIQAKLAKGTRERRQLIHDHTHQQGGTPRTRTRQEEGNIQRTHGLAPVFNEPLPHSPPSLEGRQLRT